MIKTVEQLKKERPDLVESFENMSKEHLLEQCYDLKSKKAHVFQPWDKFG